MAFDWTQVDGYRDDMSAEEKLALLNEYTPPEPPKEPEPQKPVQPAEPERPKPGFISKRDFDKVSSELAAAKKQLRSRMTEDEQREQDRLAEMEAKDQELAALRKEKALSMHKASFMGQGYDEALAEEAAAAMTDGDMDGVFAAMKKYNTAFEKSLRAKILAETPKPPASDDPNSEEARKQDREKLRKYFGLA